MKPVDKLDDYERELCESGDPADHTALLMRLMMKDNGVDPDGDWSVIDSHTDFSSCDSVSVERCNVRIAEEEKFQSISSEVVDGRRIVVVKPNRFLGELIRGTADWQKLIEVDGELGVIQHVGVVSDGLVEIHIRPIMGAKDDCKPDEGKEE